MSFTLPVGIILRDITSITPLFGPARALLDSGQVLAYRMVLQGNQDSVGFGPTIAVAVPAGDGVVWHGGADIIAADAHIPGLLGACFGLVQTARNSLNLYEAFMAWMPNDDDSHHYAELTILPSGYTLGEEDFAAGHEDVIDEIYTAMEEEDEEAPYVDTPRLLSVLLPCNTAPSAHQRVEYIQRARQVFSEWAKVDTQWLHHPQQLPIPLEAPTPQDIRTAIDQWR